MPLVGTEGGVPRQEDHLRSIEAFLIGAVLGALVCYSFTMKIPDPPATPAAPDSTCSCCLEYLDHLAAEAK